MKKIAALLCLFVSMNSWSQDFWTEFSTAQPNSSTGVRSISIVNTFTTWLNMSCGTNGCDAIRRYAKTVNGGSIWTTGEIDLGPDSQKLEVANISAVSNQVAYAAVFPKQVDTFGGIWKTSDGGTTWSKQPTASFSTPIYSYPNLVHFWNANDGVAVGDPADGYFEIYTTANGGDTWTRITSNPFLIPIDPNEYGLNNNFTVLENTIWTLTTFGRILKSTDKGLTWTVSQSPITDAGCGIAECGIRPKIAFTDQNNGLIQDDNYQLYSTHDGGATWETLDWTGVLRNFNIAAVPGLLNTYISIGADVNGQRGSSYSIDGGVTWFDINNNPDLIYVDGGQIAMLNEDFGFAGGFTNSPTDGGIFRWGGGPLLRTAILANPAFYVASSYQVYPNPTTGLLNIQGKNIKQVEVVDVLGKTVGSAKYDSADNATYDISALRNGIYMLKVSNSEDTVSMKIFKQ